MQKVKTFFAKLTGYIAIWSWLTLFTFIFLYLLLSKICVTLEIFAFSIIRKVDVKILHWNFTFLRKFSCVIHILQQLLVMFIIGLKLF